jgi:hypothetical protein
MKLQTGLIVAAAIAGVLAVSNPSKERYLDYATEEFVRTGKTTFCNDLPSTTQQQCKLAMSLLVSQGKPLIKKLIDTSTKQQNLILFSIYETEMPNRKLTTIAAFGNFHMFK